MKLSPKLLGLFLILGCTTNKKLTAPLILTNFIGAEASQIIQASATITAYSLNPEIEPTSSSFNGFAVVGESINLNKVDVDALKKIVLNEESYLVDKEAYNACSFLPELGFRFSEKQKNKQVHTDLLVSFFCDKWMFKVVDGNKIKSCKTVKQELLLIAKENFLDNQYFHSL